MKVSMFVVIVLCMVAASSAGRGARRYCGRVLADTLAYLCPEMEEVEKRSGAQYARYGWQSPESREGARGKRGVVDECCYNSCTLDVLLSYC
uniref:Bombyxin B-1 homolog n=1 Tax=Samia cynthia TaxID=7127 RepID=BXB1_SAMCY|nr:RecName: Full=Bombyxin B-1 homolog; Contains: RecName: Full=Bombyxin B-1 homolog B chain; Contains: RecName: Full=Bombyxin B-1 homolog A chain; Flags: Precursor [Samia cynthia]BAA03020.1 Samia bombyxin homolog B-1 [Samia ricini]